MPNHKRPLLHAMASPSLQCMYVHSPMLSVLGAFTIIVALAQANLPALLGALIDHAVHAHASTQEIAWYAGASIMVQLLIWGCTLLATYSRWSGTNALRSALITHVLAQPLSFFRMHGIGELTERFDSDVNEVAGFFVDTGTQLVRAAVVTVTVCVILAATNQLFVLILGCYVVVGATLVHRTQRTNATAWERERRADAAAFDTLEETLVGTAALQAVRAESFAFSMLQPRLDARLESHRRASLQSQWGNVASGVVVAGGWMIAAGVGYWRFRNGMGSIGDAVALIGYTRLMGDPMTIFGTEYAAIQRAKAAFARCDAILETPSDRIFGDTTLPLGSLAVTLDGVSFAYEHNNRFALSDISVTIPAGSHIAIIGRTGSGKTTLGRLVARLEQAHSGVITIGGIPLESVNEASLRQRVGVISQDVDVFPTTLRENLRAYDATIHDSAVVEQIGALGLQDWYATFTDGLDTVLGGSERGLTPGEAQLIALVRVALRRPGLVILDEASAHIDPQTERLLRAASRRIALDRTTITIAHRMSTIEAAEYLVVLADGHIVERGTPAELAALPTSQYALALANELRGDA